MLVDVENGQVRSFALITGMEIVGTVKEVTDSTYVLSKAYALIFNQTEQRINVQLRPFSPFAMEISKDGSMDVVLERGSVLISIKPPESLIKQYQQMTGSIITPEEKKIIVN